ncbi:hypothetical protein NDU88_004994 [Pleurodeles waltl]|uniref:Uncharacterized protein n=1 Tax=Pleurodeles waltl TaxID=8319 RepID=A0AAV7PHA0_PLEWA|nr:hypothetical protein NDU88_004994 [Pleurodeles waltl]
MVHRYHMHWDVQILTDYVKDGIIGPDGPLGALTGSFLGGENGLLGGNNGGLLGGLLSGENGSSLEGIMIGSSDALLAGLFEGENGGLLGDLLSKGKGILSGLLRQNGGLKGSGEGEGNTSEFLGKASQIGVFEKGNNGGHENGHEDRNTKGTLVDESGIIEGITESSQVDESLIGKLNAGVIGGKEISAPWDNEGDLPGRASDRLTEDYVVIDGNFEGNEVFRGPIDIVKEPRDIEPSFKLTGKIVGKDDGALDRENNKIGRHEHIGDGDIHRDLVGEGGVGGQLTNEFRDKNGINTMSLGGILSDDITNPKDKIGIFRIKDDVFEGISAGSNGNSDNLGGLAEGTFEGIDGDAFGSKNSDFVKEFSSRIMGGKKGNKYANWEVSGGDDLFEVLENENEIGNDIEGKNIINSNGAFVERDGDVARNIDGMLLVPETGNNINEVEQFLEDESGIRDLLDGPTHTILEEGGHLKSITDGSKKAASIINNNVDNDRVLVAGIAGERDGNLGDSLGENNGDFFGGDKTRNANEIIVDETRSPEQLFRKGEGGEFDGSTNGESQDLGRPNKNMYKEDVIIGGYIEKIRDGVEVVEGLTDSGGGETIIVREPNGSRNEGDRFVEDLIENFNGGEQVVGGLNDNGREGGRSLGGFIEEVNAAEELDAYTTRKGGIAGEFHDNVNKEEEVVRGIFRSDSGRSEVLGELNGSISEVGGDLGINGNLFMERGLLEEIDETRGSASKNGEDSELINSIRRAESVVDVINSKESGGGKNVSRLDSMFSRRDGFDGELSGNSDLGNGSVEGFRNNNIEVGSVSGGPNDNVSGEKVTGTFGGLQHGLHGGMGGGRGDKGVSLVGRRPGNFKSGNLGGNADLFGGIIGEY